MCPIEKTKKEFRFVSANTVDPPWFFLLFQFVLIQNWRQLIDTDCKGKSNRTSWRRSNRKIKIWNVPTESFEVYRKEPLRNLCDDKYFGGFKFTWIESFDRQENRNRNEMPVFCEWRWQLYKSTMKTKKATWWWKRKRKDRCDLTTTGERPSDRDADNVDDDDDSWIRNRLLSGSYVE